MTWVLIALALAAGVEWRRVALAGRGRPRCNGGSDHRPWWRARPVLSMRATRFCEAVSGELRAGATLRASVEAAAFVEAVEISRCCRQGAPMNQVAPGGEVEFSEIGPELETLLARADGLGVSPAALFDEIGARPGPWRSPKRCRSHLHRRGRRVRCSSWFRSSPSAGPSHGAGSTGSCSSRHSEPRFWLVWLWFAEASLVGAHSPRAR